jgi:hypothetical protein
MTDTVAIPMQGAADLEIKFQVRRLTLVRERVHYYVEVFGPVEAGDRGLEHLVEYAKDRVTLAPAFADTDIDTAFEHIGFEGVMALCAEIGAGGAAPLEAVEGMRAVLNIIHRADEYDPYFDTACDCPACTRPDIDDHPRCRFAFERPVLADIMAQWNWDLITECWDLPWYVYQARADAASIKAKGDAVPYQQRAKAEQDYQEYDDIYSRVMGD